MGAASSVTTDNTSTSADAIISFSDEEFEHLIESFFNFYKNGRGKHMNSDDGHGKKVKPAKPEPFRWNFDHFESSIDDSLFIQSDKRSIEQLIKMEFFRSVATIHPLQVYHHIVDYISSNVMGLIGEDKDDLLSIFRRYDSQVRKLVVAAQLLDLAPGSRATTTISFSDSQEVKLAFAIKSLNDICGNAEKYELLRKNSFPKGVEKYLTFSLNGHHFEDEFRKILISYFLLFRGKLLPLILDLKSEVLLWAKKFDERESISTTPIAQSDARPSPNAVIGVSLRFLMEFVANNEIPADMSTAKVVSDIIVPKTRTLKETYVNALLLPKPHFLSDLRKDYNKDNRVLIAYGNGSQSSLEGFRCFLSHAWSMPFAELVHIAEHAADLHFKAKTDLLTQIVSHDDVLDSSFFWVDVFCKNQHVPAPAMDEFHKALKAPGVAVVALYPKEPIAFQRIWCLFEIWTAVVNNIVILPTMSEEAFKFFSAKAKKNFESRHDLAVPVPSGDSHTIKLRKTVTEQFKSKFLEEMLTKLVVHVETAQATVPADIDLIMGLINQSTTVAKLNEDIFKAVCETLWERIENEYGYSKAVFCFDGEAAVSMWDGTTKKVKEVRVGMFNCGEFNCN